MQNPVSDPAQDQAPPSDGDQTPEDERIKALNEEAKAKEAKQKPDFEVFRSQIAPFDILPFVKPNHWSTLSLEIRANKGDYAGSLVTAPITLKGQPNAVSFVRDARLVREQRTRLSMQLFLPEIPKELGVDLVRPEQIRPDEQAIANLRVLEPHQMLIPVLSKKANDSYAKWNNLRALIPTSSGTDVIAIEKSRYYRLVLPLEPEKPLLLSPHPLTWTVISHIIWDGLEPDSLSPAQQGVMLDWLHWGGQLIIVGGAGPNFAPLRESFLGPYLPADLSGTNFQLTEEDLKPLSNAYPPLTKAPDPDEPQPEVQNIREAYEQFGKRYMAVVPIKPASNRPVFLSGLTPKPGATPLPIGESGDGRYLAVEGRVGRGRIMMLALNPTDPAFTAWPGLDTFVRRAMLRRPEEQMIRALARRDGGLDLPRYASLKARDLSWIRYLGRDLGPGEVQRVAETARKKNEFAKTGDPVRNLIQNPQKGASPRGSLLPTMMEQEINSGNPAVAEWVDSAPLPRLCRDILEEASGLSIPSSTFVLKVMLAYLIALVPANWLICRYAIGRKELAWVVVPILSMLFAIGVERAASFDMGFNAASDEIDILELQSDYPRGHLSRFGSIYASSRVQFSISYPNESSALALPFDSGRSLRGEDVIESTFQAQPIPSLKKFRVQPRSYSMYRAEQMYGLEGPIHLKPGTDSQARSIENQSELDLNDAILLEGGGNIRLLGNIGKGESVDLSQKEVSLELPSTSATGTLKPDAIYKLIYEQKIDRPEEKGLLRLVAWTPTLLGGQEIEPRVDRERGFTLIVVDLVHGLPPSPDGPMYDAMARGADLTPTFDTPVTDVNRGMPNIPDRTKTSQPRSFQVR